MIPTEKAKSLVDKFSYEIGSSDFHVPEFISGVPMANGSVAYTEILERETESLAKECAIIAVDEILDVLGSAGVYGFADPQISEYWQKIKEEISK